jgi:hypothetical protein
VEKDLWFLLDLGYSRRGTDHLSEWGTSKGRGGASNSAFSQRAGTVLSLETVRVILGKVH